MVKFMLVLIDLGSKFIWVYFMAHKSEAAAILRTHFSKHGSSRFLKSDNALELTGAAMNQLKAYFGIVQWTTCDYTSEQNPAERAIRAIHEKSSTFAAHTNIDPDFGWPMLAWMSANSINTLPQLGIPDHQSAYETRFGQPWSFKLDRIPGARAFVHSRGTNKFATHALAGIYLGRSYCSMLRRGFVVLLVETGKLVISPSVYVQEDFFPLFDKATFCSRDEDSPVLFDPLLPPAAQLDGPLFSHGVDGAAGDKQLHPHHDPSPGSSSLQANLPPAVARSPSGDDDEDDFPIAVALPAPLPTLAPPVSLPTPAPSAPAPTLAPPATRPPSPLLSPISSPSWTRTFQ